MPVIEKIGKAFNRHVHLRGFQPGEIGPSILQYHAMWCRRIRAIGNWPPIREPEDALVYQEAIRQVCKELDLDLQVTLAPMLDSGVTTERTIQDFIRTRNETGFDSLKFMPRGASTTSSIDGGHTVGVDLEDLGNIYPALAALEDYRIPLLMHLELPDHDALDDRGRETKCIPVLFQLRRDFPKLPISVEHITTRELLEVVRRLYGQSDGLTVGTVTPQGMCLTWNQVLSNVLKPYNLCRPPAKQSPDCRALAEAVFLDGAKFLGCGTDCAPHEQKKKESDSIPCGIFNSPVALSIYAEICEHYGGNWERLEDFLTRTWPWEEPLKNGSLDQNTVDLIEDPWSVEFAYSGIRPLKSGERLKYRILKA